MLGDVSYICVLRYFLHISHLQCTPKDKTIVKDIRAEIISDYSTECSTEVILQPTVIVIC